MYTIGQLALILKTSTRTLRHYDNIGLLKPCHVDEENGYRYYEKEQMQMAEEIMKYKECGLSLEEIKEIMSNRNKDNNAIIKKRMILIENDIKKLTFMKDNLCRLLSDNKTAKNDVKCDKKYDIQIVQWDDIIAVSSRCRINTKNIGDAVGSIYEKINKNGLRVTGGHIVKYFEDEYDPEDADVEIYVPVESRKESKLKITTIEKRKYINASANSISEKGNVYESIINWAQINGYKITGHPLEKYSINYQTGLFNIDVYYPLDESK